jgi:hypothetical protein
MHAFPLTLFRFEMLVLDESIPPFVLLTCRAGGRTQCGCTTCSNNIRLFREIMRGTGRGGGSKTQNGGRAAERCMDYCWK